ncbi:UV damage repair protein UvrX [Metasolibacillus meyeri]|uniref:UV damage repair protein UvrX n=1 Tax=Metasolibacillus meyeri TaxID=1071052 RepID=A0AAW9NNM6_9BACL|nr:UV damage repair protein UvrX [Metasolibacillus meyeri]MEC1179152.1 UV damage repair protein UvrX [Metasolibacillus meyeri]
MYNQCPERAIFCIDMKCFYASCMAMLEGLDVLREPIAIVGNLNQAGSIVLAASPPMKEHFHIQTGSRRYDIPNHPSIKLFEPKMSFFLQMSIEITKLIMQFVPREAIYVYSVDESFVDLTGTEKLWGAPEETALTIQRAIYNQFAIPSSVGMGPNMLMAKLALDIEAKSTGFARWTYQDVPKKLWPVTPLSKMWGIGRRMEHALNKKGIFSVGDLAHAELHMLEQEFGIIGNQLFYHAWGIDLSTFEEPSTKEPMSFGKGQMLMRDYHTEEEVLIVLLEMCEDIAKRARMAGYIGATVSLGISYSRTAMEKSLYRSKTMLEPTNETMKMYNVCKELFAIHFAQQPVRQLSLRLSNLQPDGSIQLDLFDEHKEQRQMLGYTMDAIRERFGATSLLRAVSFTESGTAFQREQLVGGHLK